MSKDGSEHPMPTPALIATPPRQLLVLALIAGLAFAATFSLWAYYGTAVFFELVRAGWLACF